MKMSSEKQSQNNNDSKQERDPEQDRLSLDIRKIFNVFHNNRGNSDLKSLCPFFDEEESTSRARSIVHSIFLNAYLTSLKVEGNICSFVRAFGSTQIPCKNNLCQFVIGMGMYQYFSNLLNSDHFIHRTMGTGRNQIHPAASGCGFYHTPEQISETYSRVFVEMQQLEEEMEKDFFEIPRRINNFIEKNYFNNIPKKAMQVFQFNGPREKIYLQIPNFNDDTIFGKPEFRDDAIVSMGKILNNAQLPEQRSLPPYVSRENDIRNIDVLAEQFEGIEKALMSVGVLSVKNTSVENKLVFSDLGK